MQSQASGDSAAVEPKDLLSVTVLVDGIPEPKEYGKDERIEAVIKSLLSEPERHEWDKWQLTDQRLGTNPLPSNQTLHEAGVRSGDVLALNKKDGGGGTT
jgi:hypothetical protein